MTIKEFRKSQGLSQTKLAEALGIGVSTVGGYESGRINPSAKVIDKVREVFGVDLNDDAPRAVEEIKPARRATPKRPVKAAAKANVQVIIQSSMGGEITVEEIMAKVGEVDRVYVRVDQNAAYWVKGDASGAVNLW